MFLPSNQNMRTYKKLFLLKEGDCWKKMKNNVQQQHNYVVFFIHRMYLFSFFYDFFVCFVAIKYLWCLKHFPKGIDKMKNFLFLLLWYLTHIKPDEDILNFSTLTELLLLTDFLVRKLKKMDAKHIFCVNVNCIDFFISNII